MALYIFISVLVTWLSLEGSLCDCVPPIDVANASYYPLNTSYPENTTVVYSCGTNFILSGNSDVTCVSSTWLGSLPTCTQVCPTPRELPNAYIVSSPPYYTGTNVVYQCQARFEMSGAAFMTCSDLYVWVGEPPSCNQVDSAPRVHNSNVYFYGQEGAYSAVTDTVEDGSTGAEEEQSPFIEDDGLIPVIVFGILLGLLLLGMIIFLILRLCCCGDMCNCCGPGGRYPGCGACCMGSLGLGEMAGYGEDQSGCCRPCCCKKKQHKNQAQKTRFRMAIARVMGRNRRQTQPKQVQGWMPHKHDVRGNHFTSTK